MQTKTSGCGCGGGRAGGCGCGSAAVMARAFAPAAVGAATCAPCETAAFVRPRFFAGQLLTEDDLGALTDYTLAKQRLHNTHLLGAGVACGLAVACGPRGPQGSSQVVVEAGYAIDGCGNDLVLSCARTLDLAPMIRELAAGRAGGCAEPCLPTAGAMAANGAAGTTKAASGASHSYDLYVRYAERPDQPVAAYPVGDDCDAGAPGCEPTRILEGVAFELRCQPSLGDATEDADARARRAGALAPTPALLAQVGFYERYHRQLAHLLERPPVALTGAAAALDAAEVEALRAGSVELTELLAGRTPAQRLSLMGDYLARVAGPLARLERARLAAPPGVAAELIAQNATRAADAIAIAMSDPVVALPASERAFLVEAERLWGKAGDTEADPSPDLRLFLAGVIATPAIADALGGELGELVRQLQSSAACRGEIHADCALRDAIEALEPRAPLGDLAVLSKQLGDVADAVRRYFDDRRAAELSPPCPAPGEPAVLLARVEVDRCRVVRI